MRVYMGYDHRCLAHGHLHLFQVTVSRSRHDRSMVRDAGGRRGYVSLRSDQHHGQATHPRCRNIHFVLRKATVSATVSSQTYFENSHPRHNRSNNFTTSDFLSIEAACKAVWWSSFGSSTFAPRSSNDLTIPTLPSADALCNAMKSSRDYDEYQHLQYC